MTKKIFAMFLAVLMVVSVLPISVFAAEANCPGKGNHTLENCSYTLVKVTDPTCGTNGYTSYKCNVCGEIFATNYVAPTGEHTLVDLEAKAPTCGEAGYEAGKKCSVCGFKIPGAAIPALHGEGTPCEWIDKTPAIDCETGGKKVWECAACGATKTEEVKKGEHNWDDANPVLLKAPTASENGLAKVTCTICKKEKEVVVFYTHDCVKVYVPAVAATCETDGMKEHWICRICGEIFTSATATEPATAEQKKALVIKGGHTFDHEATCVDTVLYCSVCEKNIVVNVEHVIDWDNWDWNGVSKTTGEYVAPTCTKSGYVATQCKVCVKYRDVKILPALEHKDVTVTVPATCGTYGYTFTYCTRKGCQDTITVPAGYEAKVEVLSPITSAPAAGQGFYLGFTQENLGTDLFFTGKMDGYYLATSHDVSKAVKVYLEIVHPALDNQYRIYFFNAEGVKTYIDIYEYEEGRVGVRLSTTVPANNFAWNDTYKIMTCTFKAGKYTNEYYLGTTSSYDTLAVKYIYKDKPDADGLFEAVLSNTGVKADANVISFTIADKAGYNAQNHVLESSVIIEPTCKEAGLKQVFCVNCAYSTTVEIPASHTYEKVAAAQVQVNGVKVDSSKPVSCEDGWQYFACTRCGDVKKETYTGYGHKWTDVKEETPDHINTVVYDHYDCVYCGKRVNTTRKVWADVNKHWNTVEEALKAHPQLDLSSKKNIKSGNCTEYGLDIYTCTGCNKVVYVKEANTGDHIVPAGAYQAPTCTEPGWILTYKCSRCDAIIGKAPLGEKNTIKATGHDWKEIEGYKAAACDKPNYSNNKYECADCGLKKTDGTTLIKKVVATNNCVETTFEYYNCHCGEEHMRSFISKLGHNMVALDKKGTHLDENGEEIANYQAPTCYAEGYEFYQCTYCSTLSKNVLATTEHVNAAGEKFTDKCNDTVTDRHCVTCHKHYAHDTLGTGHDCTTLDADKNGVLDCPCMIGKKHHWSVNTNMPSTCLEDAYTIKVCADCGKEDVTFMGWGWSGHKPAAVDKNENGEEIRYANYKYVDNFHFVSFEVVDGQFVKNEETYTAKVLEYVAPSYAADGYWKGYCTECKMEVTQVLPRLEGVGVELDATNANGTGSNVTFGSLISVEVSLNSLNTGIYGFEMEIPVPAGTVFVGSEVNTEDFIVFVTDRKNVKDTVKISGYAANNADGKMQNIVINEKTSVVTLNFRVYKDSTAPVVFNLNGAEAYDLAHFNDANKGLVYCSDASAKLNSRLLGDFNGDKVFHITDIYTAMTLLTGENTDGKTYDVTVDFDKDGVITAYDLSLAYNKQVGNISAAELFLEGVDADEALFLNSVIGNLLDEEYHCNNSSCTYKSFTAFTYCPVCGNHQ